MSESSDDAQQLAPPGGHPAPVAAEPAPDTDDVEVVLAADAPPEPPLARHDSVSPTSRKLAPPPKPKRDSNQPGSVPPPGSSTPPPVDIAALGSLKAPSAPAISFQDAGAASRGDIANALTGSDSLRAIGEAFTSPLASAGAACGAWALGAAFVAPPPGARACSAPGRS